jgi:hypothetical protein
VDQRGSRTRGVHDGIALERMEVIGITSGKAAVSQSDRRLNSGVPDLRWYT